MTFSFSSLLLPLLCGLLSVLGTWASLPFLKRHVMDVPNARSSHKAPVPRGGGIAMIASMLLGLYLAGLPLPIVCAALLLAVVSFIDDLYGLPVSLRLAIQCLAVGISIYAMSGRADLFFWLPFIIAFFAIVTAFFWLWFINLTNFMDGIDGISAMQTILMSAGITLITLSHERIPNALATQAEVMAASAFGFYLFNREPAKLFMGDVGSIPLGFLMGYLLLCLAAYGYPLPALILPAYYLTDATLTLTKRLLKGQKIWEAHSGHAYQQAVRAGLSHTEVVRRIALLNIALIGLAMAGSVSMMAGIFFALAAYGITILLIRRFTHAKAAS